MRLCRRFAPTPFRLPIPIFNFGGVYWTKFECISGKIHRILTNDTCASHARFARDPKTKNFLTIPFSAGVWGEPAKNGKENFWFWFRRFIPPERTCIYILALWRYFVRPFIRHLRRCEALPVSAFCDSSSVRSHFATTSHRPFAFAHDACSVFASYSLCGFV